MRDFYELAEKAVGVTAFSDFHAHLFQEFSKVDAEYGSDRFRTQCNALETVLDVADGKNHIVVFLGDLFHKRGAVDTLVMNHILRIFAKYSDVPILMIRGNHDSKTNSLYSESSLEAFKFMKNIKVVDTPELVSTRHAEFLCIPYGDEVDYMKEVLADGISKLTKPGFILAHVGVDGASTGKESHRLEGAFGTADFQADNPNVTAVLLGHYHKRQFLGGHNNMLYCGNTVQTSFSDEGQEKGMYHVNGFTKGSEIEFQAIDAPMFLTIDGNNVPDNIEELLEKHYVRFIGTSSQIKAVQTAIESTGTTNIRVMEKKDYDTEARIAITPKSTPEEVTKAYARQYFPKAEGVALECLKEALNNN